MTLISVALLVPHVYAQDRLDLTVGLTPDRDAGTMFTLTLLGDDDGETTLSVLPDWGGTTTKAGWFSDFAALGHQDYEWDPDTLCFTVRHEPSEQLTVSYTIRGNASYADVDDYTPLSAEQGIAFFTSNTLLLPERWFEAGKPDVRISIEWMGLNELEWIEYPTFGSSGSAFKPDRIREGMLVAGAFRSASFDHGAARFHVVELGENAAFTPGVLAEYAKPLLSSVHDYLDDHTSSDYLITYAPAGEPVENGFALGGTAVTNAFAFYFDPSVDLNANEGLAEAVSYVLCHEYVHNWNGIAFWIDEPEFEYQSRWFIEGFTDFITRRAMYEAGVRDAEWYTSEMKRVHREYDANPHRDLTNVVAAPRWIEEPEVSDMLYQRGELIALLIDQHVRTLSHGEHALRNLIQELVQGAKQGEIRVSPERIFDWIEQHAGREFREEIEHLAEHGGPVRFPDTLDTQR